MYNPDAPMVTLQDIKEAIALQNESEHVVRTPMLKQVQDVFEVDKSIALNLKLENMQVTGSFKTRGFITMMNNLPEGYGTNEKKLLTMSAGNAGKAFAFLTSKMGLKGKVLMPETAPINRVYLIQSYGVEVERMPSTKLHAGVEKCEKEENMLYLHSFDDIKLIQGHASAGMEILEDVPDPDVIVVCCGGGGLVSGIAAAVKLSGHLDCRIYGVEPEGSRTMFESYKAGKPVGMEVKSVAAGLSPPYSGPNTYRHCKKYVKDILLVSDTEILQGMFQLQKHGLMVEPSGAAAFAALYHGKVPDVKGKKVVVVITGGNVTPEELVEHKKSLGDIS